MSRSAPRRRAEKPRSRPRPPERSGSGAGPREPGKWRIRLLLVAWLLLTGAGAAAVVAGMLPWGPKLLPQAGAVVVATTYVWALAARTGGRPVVFGLLTLAVGVAVLWTGQEVLRNGAAVLTCVVSATLAVVATVPAVRTPVAVREVLVASVLAGGGALATFGLEPTADPVRFEYVTLGLALVGGLVVVYRLGAGLNGLGRRGILIVVFGGLVLGLTLAYGELLRRYGTPELVHTVDDGIQWLRRHLGASPRPIVAVLGVPALLWGVHMRARRRQGWWVCAFGVAATAPASQALLRPRVPWQEATLAIGYGVVVGLVLGYLLIRLDLALTGRHGSRGRRAEEAAALRPEPARVAALL